MAEAESHSISQDNFISTETETSGFDLSSGAKWIYPENYPRRDYQFNIVQEALYNNTLVCLPTGLGKTFIAAVVMYNFWRWYPRGKVVFLAPTKPLVAQQINACHEIMGIPSEQTVELTGAINQTKRAIAWAQRRVIFATPQTFQKDLQNAYVPCELIKCIVIDEAHKALGKHSYCEIVRMVSEKTKFFRVLALSATPGSKVDQVREVIQNLLISKLELRDDTSPDITPYTNDRTMEKIIVKLDKNLNDYKERYITIMDPHLRVLIKSHILQGSAANISKGRIFMLMKQYESRPNKAQNHGAIMKTLNILLTMYHAYELLLKNGLRAFHHFYLNHSDKFWFDAELELKLMLQDIKVQIEDFPVIKPSDEGVVPDIPENLVFGHPKFKKLQDLLVDHFKSFSVQNASTRAIVFVEYRDIVNEVYVLLLQKRPLIRPQMFVGQAGQKQKLQLAALEDFRNNKVNVLISTSVGEEGLDVGEVDLIVCFDISTSTPTRLVQRMGRTGRKRSGRVVLLLTEGKEVQTLNQAMSKKDSLTSKVLQSNNIVSSLYQSSPRMLPQNVTPECLPMFVKALPKTPKVIRGKKAAAQTTAKPPAEKKPRQRKKIDNDCLILPSPSKSPASLLKSAKDLNVHKPINKTQPSMMKFLTDQRQPNKSRFNHDADSGFSEDFQLPESRENPYSFIRPEEVKLLTCDSQALEFLTLCAMKKSDESATKNILELSLKWVPPRSPTAKVEFCDLVIPSEETLDCIRHLKLSETPRTESGDDDISISFFSDKSQAPREPCSHEESNACIEFSRRDEGTEDHWLDESRYRAAGRSAHLQELNIEEFASDFACTFEEDKRRSILVSSRQPSERVLEQVSAADSICSSFTEGKLINSTMRQGSSDSQCSPSVSLANVEVDFAELLDECSESEASETASLLAREDQDIFDDLLEGGSSAEEDLFAEQNATVERREKRRASASPERAVASPQKKRRLSEPVSLSGSSDGESTVVGSPLKPASTGQLQDDDAASEEDIFDGLDFDETQFETSAGPALTPVQDNADSPAKTSASPPAFSRQGTTTNSLALAGEGRNRETSASPVFARGGKSRSSLVGNVEPEAGRSASEPTTTEVDDWDFTPVATEEVSGFFPAKACSSSTGWISAGQKPPPARQQRALSLKNWRANSNKPEPKISGAPIEPRPRLQQPPSPKAATSIRDEDGFAVPAAPGFANKENELPVWRERLNCAKRSNGSNVSPRFRKYRSESDLCSSIEKARITPGRKRRRRRRSKARRRIASDFIEDEAEISSGCDTSEGSSGDEGLDGDLDSFVSYTQDVSDAVDMRAHYLQTINSSPVRAGAFVIKQVKRRLPDSEVFSQPVSREEREESYLHDSFCVGDETQIHAHDSDPEESILEKIESSLESRRRKMRLEREKKRSKFECLQKNKKKPTSTEASDSSEDETEILRKQIMDESMMFKR